ncbi:MAG: phytanoyl-CoA dioxygenase family protein [Planctomycetota bacterium]|nr:phytanoyl-CoA dioxygenase family protein [Planctomycetota bacterium]MDA1162111.1 phytanoyl-CoA dioxygenase family protein [Planctomycetota bacterium]
MTSVSLQNNHDHSLSANPSPGQRLADGLSTDEIAQFERDGFLVARGLAAGDWTARMLQVTREHLERELPPVELEADVHYPGSPESIDQPGGRTIRRLKQAHSRDIVFTEWICHVPLVRRLTQLLGPGVVMPLAHHNCVMTKQPHHSSDTRWHRDIRFWNFTRPELVNVWLAMGDEYPDNGGLFIIPGSHRIELQPAQLDDDQFFREDVPINQPLLDSAIPVKLSAGDVLLFHARTLHSASRNNTDQAKYSAVFTFRPADNTPLPDSRSAAAGEVVLPELPDELNSQVAG